MGQFESFLMLVTGTFSALHSAQALLIAPVGRASSGFVTKFFQHLREIHFLTPEVFAVPMIVPFVMSQTDPLPESGFALTIFFETCYKTSFLLDTETTEFPVASVRSLSEWTRASSSFNRLEDIFLP